ATTASTSVVVLPVPGPARTSRGPSSWATTACCAGSREGAVTGATAPVTSRYVGRSGTHRSDHGAPTLRSDAARHRACRHRHTNVSPGAAEAVAPTHGATAGTFVCRMERPGASGAVPARLPHVDPAVTHRDPLGQEQVELGVALVRRARPVGVQHPM